MTENFENTWQQAKAKLETYIAARDRMRKAEHESYAAYEAHNELAKDYASQVIVSAGSFARAMQELAQARKDMAAANDRFTVATEVCLKAHSDLFGWLRFDTPMKLAFSVNGTVYTVHTEGKIVTGLELQ